VEITIANGFEPGAKVLNIVNRFFGSHFVRISEAHGTCCKPLEIPWGECTIPEHV
jgi:aspartate aminotransferase-like enzyme